MGFPNDVKEKALVAAARRCCVCKEFKGINIEVHHIIPRSEGGGDTFDNAIPLCFDCHADAGHYNPRHPRGTKFSPQELKNHRDNWYRIVENGRFLSKGVAITQQYYLCNSLDIVWEMIDGNFDNFPIKNLKLVENEQFNFLTSARKFNGNFSRESDVEWESFSSSSDYILKHPDAKCTMDNWGTKHWERSVDSAELKERLFSKDFVTNYLIRKGAPQYEIARATFFEYGCGDCCYETLTLRGAKVIFMAIMNGGAEMVNCSALSEYFFNDGSLTVINSASSEERLYELSQIPLHPGECLLIPCCTVLTPFDEPYSADPYIIYQPLRNGQSQDTRAVDIDDLGCYPTIGPYHNITGVHLSSETGIVEERARPLSMNRLLKISRYWECGCCPHVLVLDAYDVKWRYMGELFSRSPNQMHVARLDIAALALEDPKLLRILELESETTYIHSLRVDDQLVLYSRYIHKGEQITVDVSSVKNVIITGCYYLYPHVNYRRSLSIKGTKVFHAISDLNSSLDGRNEIGLTSKRKSSEEDTSDTH